MFLRVCIFTAFLLASLVAFAQSPDEALEQWLDEGAAEEQVGAVADHLLQLAEEPVNLNDTSLLDEVPFLSAFQRMALRNYIVLYGQMLSQAELLLVPGFDSATVALLAPYVRVAPLEQKAKWRLSDGHHNLVAGVGGTVEQAAGYRNGRYEGDNLRALLSYTYNYHNKVQLRLVADKDPTEAWGKYNFYSYHLSLRDLGPVRKLILGRYNLQFGQGLTLWTGLQPLGLMGMSTMRFGRGLRPSSTFYEEGYQEGIAATVGLGYGIELTGFASRVDGENLFGGHVGWRRGNLVVGTTVAYTLLEDSIAPRNYVYNAHYFRGDRLLNGGVDAMWQWRRLTLYGEAAIDGDGHAAFLAGINVASDGDNRFGISYRHYDPLYHNLHAQAYSIGTTQAENGVALDASLRLPWKITGLLSADIHHFPTMRYGNYRPSSGKWLRASLIRRWNDSHVLQLRYAYRQKERNIPGSSDNLYVGEETLRQQLQFDYRMYLGLWQLTARGIYAAFDSEHGEPQRGWLAYVSARYTWRKVQCTAGAAWHDVGGYYARIYLNESQLQYAWSMPMLTGRGLRAHAMLHWSLNDHLRLSARYAISYFPGQEAIGSGNSQTEGPARQTWHVQLRWRF